MKPYFDRERFGADVKAWLAREGLSHRDAQFRYHRLNPAMLSRAIHMNVLSIESLLAICAASGLDPMAYADVKPMENHAVTASVKRETLARIS